MFTTWKLFIAMTLLISLASCAPKEAQDQSLSIKVDPEQPCVSKVLLESEFDNCLLTEDKQGRCLDDPECVCISPGKQLTWTVDTDTRFELVFDSRTWFDSCDAKSSDRVLKCEVAENAEKGVYEYQVVLEGCEGYDPRIVIWY